MAQRKGSRGTKSSRRSFPSISEKTVIKALGLGGAIGVEFLRRGCKKRKDHQGKTLHFDWKFKKKEFNPGKFNGLVRHLNQV